MTLEEKAKFIEESKEKKASKGEITNLLTFRKNQAYA